MNLKSGSIVDGDEKIIKLLGPAEANSIKVRIKQRNLSMSINIILSTKSLISRLDSLKYYDKADSCRDNTQGSRSSDPGSNPSGASAYHPQRKKNACQFFILTLYKNFPKFMCRFECVN